MAAQPEPLAQQLHNCPINFTEDIEFPQWTRMATYSPPTIRTLQWLYRVVKTVEKNCTLKLYFGRYKELPLLIGQSIGNNVIG